MVGWRASASLNGHLQEAADMSRAPVILAVVPTDALRTSAVRRAIELARRSGGTLYLCSFVHDPLVDAAGMRGGVETAVHARHALLDEQLIALRALAAECAETVADVRCEAVWAALPHESILARAAALEADYVVKDCGRESLLSRVLFTPLDSKLVRLLPCALMLVRVQAPPCPQRILAAVDVLAEGGEGAELTERLMHTARELAACSGASLDLVSVAPAMPARPGIPFDAAAVLGHVRASHAAAFEALADHHGVAPERRHCLAGIPGERIAALARAQGMDLVVVGNAHHGALARMLLGSTAEGLLQHLECDMVVVKRGGLAELLARQLEP